MDIKDKIEKIDKPVVGVATAGCVSCGFIGSHIGIATLGLAFPATIPLAVIGGAVGALGVYAYRGFKKK